MSFSELAESRRAWISNVLAPWCRTAVLADLREAEHDWQNIAGRVDPQATLWSWAWSRFPALVVDGMAGVSESQEVRVVLKDGSVHDGFPDNRRTTAGKLVLLGRDPQSGTLTYFGPFSIDAIDSAERTDPDAAVSAPPPRTPTVLPPDTPIDVRF